MCAVGKSSPPPPPTTKKGRASASSQHFCAVSLRADRKSRRAGWSQFRGLNDRSGAARITQFGGKLLFPENYGRDQLSLFQHLHVGGGVAGSECSARSAPTWDVPHKAVVTRVGALYTCVREERRGKINAQLKP